MADDDYEPRRRRPFYGIRRPRQPRERDRFSYREACQDPTKLPLVEALRRTRLQRKGLPWEPRPRYLREEYTPPKGEPDPER